jgi:WS/DGAT/MGAT family acyltransferase
MRQMSLLDAAMLALETPESPMQMSGASVFRLPSGAGSDFVRNLYEQWLAVEVTRPPLNYRLAGASIASPLPSWEILGHVDPREHLFRSALPYPGDDHELSALIGRLHSTPLDRSRPMWEIHLIEGLRGRRFAYYTKVHHSLVDGINAARLFMAPFSEDPGSRDRHPPWSAPGPGEPEREGAGAGGISQAWAVVRQLGSRLASAGQLSTSGSELLAQLRALAELGSRDTAAPDSPLNRVITCRRVTEAVTLELARLRDLGRVHDATINDVALTICGSALRQYLQELGQLPRESLRCLVPVAFRGKDRPSMGNAASAMTVTLATDVDDPLRRLAAISEATRIGKASLEKVTSNAVKMLYGTRLVLPLVIEQLTGGYRFGQRAFNLAISNVPGPRQKQYLYGAEMERTVPTFIIGDGMALSILLTSYDEHFCISYTACPDTLPRIERLTGLLRESFAELEASLGRARAGQRTTRRLPVKGTRMRRRRR